MKIAVFIAHNGEVCAMLAEIYERIKKESEKLSKKDGTQPLPDPILIIDTDNPKFVNKSTKGGQT